MIRVMLVDDHQGVRRGLVELLSATPDIVVVAECSDGNAAVATARTSAPDVVLMDLAMPGVDGLEATRLLLAERPDTRVVILSGRLTHALATSARAAGAMGYVLKTDEADAVPQAVRTVMAGRSAWSPSVASILELA